MNLEKEFSNYVKDFSKNFDYDITDNEIKNMYEDFFSNNDGTINYLISSKIQDLIYEKQKEISKNNELEK